MQELNRKRYMEKLLNEKPHLREYLFVRGFLMTSRQFDESEYPFYGNWNHSIFEGFHFYIHNKMKGHFAKGEQRSCFLIGHAYNPFTMEIHEDEILKKMVSSDYSELIEILNQLTGVFTFGFIENGALTVIADCAGMQISYYGYIHGELYVSTHMQMIGDLCDLNVSKYVQELTSYRFYHFYGSFLPGDLSSYEEVKRIVPNTAVTFRNGTFSIKRFYPTRPLKMCVTQEEYDQKIEFISDLMRKNVRLISEKWEHPAISMSGGMDSKGTVAGANGMYDRFELFSYVSMPGEQIDADAAHKIAEAIGAEHRIDYISSNDQDYQDIEAFREILKHNYGNIGRNNANDVRKRVFYTQDGHCKFDIEAKSWVSEVGRANYYKKFGFHKMPKRLNARQMTSMYKLFVHNRKLVLETDAIFKQYIKDTSFDDIFNYDSSDMFLWEMRYGGWGGQVITCEHRFAFDITVPYNNRLMMEAFLTLPLEKRISDQAHYDMIRNLNPIIDQTGITIVNYNETKKRMYKEKLYYLVNTHLPF